MLRQNLEKIEHFHYIFNGVTSQRSSGSISTHYTKYAIALSEAADHNERQSVFHEMIEGLRRKKPSFSEFKANFVELVYSSKHTKSKGLIKYTLRKLIGNTPIGISIDFDTMTIEHLLPEAAAKNDVAGLSVGNIGNLILIDRDTNSNELGDLPFLQKKVLLIEKGYPLEDYIAQQTVWTEIQIKERAEALADIIYTRVAKI